MDTVQKIELYPERDRQLALTQSNSPVATQKGGNQREAIAESEWKRARSATKDLLMAVRGESICV